MQESRYQCWSCYPAYDRQNPFKKNNHESAFHAAHPNEWLCSKCRQYQHNGAARTEHYQQCNGRGAHSDHK